MVLNRMVSIVRRRWLTAVIVAVLVAVLGVMLSGRQQAGASGSTSMTQVGVAGPLREHEQYSVDLNTVAQDVCMMVAPYLKSDVVLSKIRTELPMEVSLAELRGMVEVSILPNSSIIDIQANGLDSTETDLVVGLVRREAISLIETMGDKRFEGDSPLTVTVLLDSTVLEKEAGSTTILVIAALVLALVAAIAAAWLREILDGRLRDAPGVRHVLDGSLPVIDGAWDGSARHVRAELDVTGARVVLAVPASRGDAGPAFAQLAASFAEAGQPCRAVVVGSQPAPEGFTTIDSLGPDALASAAATPQARVAAGPDVDATLTDEAVTAAVAQLQGDGARVLVLVDRPRRSTAFSLLRRSADAVVVVATAGKDSKSDLRATVAQVREVRADRSGDVVWFGA